MQAKYRVRLEITTQENPQHWDLQNFYWAIENGEAEIVSREQVPMPGTGGCTCPVEPGNCSEWFGPCEDGVLHKTSCPIGVAAMAKAKRPCGELRYPELSGGPEMTDEAHQQVGVEVERAQVLALIREAAEHARGVAADYKSKRVEPEARAWRLVDEGLGRVANRIERGEHNLMPVGPAWEDADDEWTAAVKAAFPTRSGSHDEYGIAMRMVGHRHSKGALVALVNWLLVVLKRLADASQHVASLNRDMQMPPTSRTEEKFDEAINAARAVLETE